jgi:PAS domain S-box-containing protein
MPDNKMKFNGSGAATGAAAAAKIDADGALSAMAESREWLRVTLSSIGDAVICTDSGGCVTFMNPVAQALTGWTQDEASGTALDRIFRIVNETTRQPVENPVARSLREGVVVGLANHSVLIAKDGTERPIDDSASPIRNEQGEVAGCVLVFRDISERKRHEQKLAETLTFAQAILNTMQNKFVVLDGDLRVTSANSRFFRTFEVTEEETVGGLIYELGGGQWNIPRLRTLLEEVLSKNDSFENYEVEADFPAVGHRVMALNGCRLRFSDRPDLILLGIEDVTQARADKVRIRDSEMRYRRLFQTAKDGILILDAHTGKIIDANAFMSGLLGQEVGEILGKELWEIGLFKDIEVNKAAFKELQEKGYIRYDHLPVKNARNEVVEVEFVSNVYHEDQRLVAQCNVRDIAQRTRMEREIARQSRILTDMHRKKDEFLAILSHELRNPLAPILNATHILRLQERGSDNLIQQQARDVIERQVGTLSKLINDLLDVARIASGRVRLRTELVELRDVVQLAVETTSPLTLLRRHEVVQMLPAQPVWVNVDPARLEEVVVNLLNNASKFTNEGGRITVTVEQQNGNAVLRIADTGIGIAPEMLPRIFDLFTQADRSLDRAQGGLGIGLHLVERLIKLHGGSIEACSAGPGKGSEFIIRLPISNAPATSVPENPAAPLEPERMGLRVLVVDDNIDSCNSLATLLRLNNCVVQTAYTGLTAVQSATNWRPEVMVIDIGLPEIDGFEVCRRLRQQFGPGRMRLIALTGYGQDSDIKLSREAGFDAHLLKPVDLDELKRLVFERNTAPPAR